MRSIRFLKICVYAHPKTHVKKKHIPMIIGAHEDVEGLRANQNDLSGIYVYMQSMLNANSKTGVRILVWLRSKYV